MIKKIGRPRVKMRAMELIGQVRSQTRTRDGVGNEGRHRRPAVDGYH
jgi:hypothetical protein